MQFGPDDEAFSSARDALLDELEVWLRDHRGPTDHDLAGSAHIFIDWRWGYSSGELDRYEPRDIEEFLLEWCPRKLSAAPTEILEVGRAVKAFIEFMAATDRLVGGAAAAARLIVTVDDLTPRAVEAMGDPSNFGMAKSLFAPMLADPRSLLAELPFVHVAPDFDDVEASAAVAPVLARFDVIRERLAESGGKLTATGNLNLADARALVELLDTGDPVDEEIGDRVFRTSSVDELPVLSLMLDWAKRSGAVRVNKGRLVPIKAWAGRTAIERTERTMATLLELGPLFGLYRYSSPLDDLHDLLDDGVLHWLTLLLPTGAEVAFTDICHIAGEAVDAQIDLGDQAWITEHLEGIVAREVGAIMDLLQVAGVISWDDRAPVDDLRGRKHWTGGHVRLTPLGHHLVPTYVERIGYRLHSIDDPAATSATELIESVLRAGIEPTEIAPRWRTDLSDHDRAGELTDAILGAVTGEERLAGFALLRALDRDQVAAPLIRQLLDSPLAGHATMFLLETGQAEPDEVGEFLDEAPLIDLLSTLVDEPELLAQMFTQAIANLDDPAENLLDAMWRHPMPETLSVLEALGKHLPDKRLAKAARKATMQHRSWMANPDR